MEKRKTKRYPRRFKVRYGEKGFAHTGLTADVSVGGAFIVTVQPPAPGTRLAVELTLGEGRLLHFEGMVARQTLVPPELRTIKKGGFGFRFLSYPELLGEMVPHLRDKSRFVLTYPTKPKFQQAWEKELSKGGLFLVLEAEHAAGATLTVELDFAYLPQHHAFPVKVMHVVAQPDGRFGTSLMFVDPIEAAATLSTVLGL